jgi:hypothetical protein
MALPPQSTIPARPITDQVSSPFPAKFAIRLLNRHIVDTSKVTHHQTIFGKLPIFVAIGAIPESRIIVLFVFKAHSDPVIHKTPEFFA